MRVTFLGSMFVNLAKMNYLVQGKEKGKILLVSFQEKLDFWN